MWKVYNKIVPAVTRNYECNYIEQEHTNVYYYLIVIFDVLFIEIKVYIEQCPAVPSYKI